MRKKIIGWASVALAFIILAIILSISLHWGILESLRIVFGTLYVVFVPGMLLTYVFFDENEVDMLERVTLGITLSLAVVPLMMFLLNRMGVKINTLTVFLEIFGLIFLSIGIIIFRMKKGFMAQTSHKNPSSAPGYHSKK